jgi:putative nucleotidyltransferase with HDIG domain
MAQLRENSLKIGIKIFSSFRFRVALVLVTSLLFVASLTNFLIYQYARDTQFNQLRDKLKVIAQTSALSINARDLLEIPLNKEGINTSSYQIIVNKLRQIKQANPVIKYIYTMTKTSQEGVWQFIVDPDTVVKKDRFQLVTSFPGDKYDATRFPEMLKAYDGPTADKALGQDEWGKVLSGYAPIRDQNGVTVAIIGVDISANDVYLAQKGILHRGIFILILGIVFSLGLGVIVSSRITSPIKRLVEGTRHISDGNLEYRVRVSGRDEIAELSRSFNEMAASLFEAKKKLRDYFFNSMESLVRILEAKDPYTKGHSDRVSKLTENIARVLGFPEEKVEMLRRAAQLHDIGKLSIDERILNKEDQLSAEEWEIIHRHPASAGDILEPITFDKEFLEIVRSHHERFDGTGYPNKVCQKDVDLLYQVIPVVDAYDAMTSNRAYRGALTRENAIEALRKNSGTQFNPEVVEALIKII